MHSGHHRGRENPILLPHKGGEATHAARGSNSSDEKIASPPPGACRTAAMATGVGGHPTPCSHSGSGILSLFFSKQVFVLLVRVQVCYGALTVDRGQLAGPRSLLPQSGCQGIRPSHQI